MPVLNKSKNKALFFFKLILSIVLVSALTSCDKKPSQTDVLVTLKPIHSLALALTHTTPIKVDLLGGGINSPHQYALKPSDMKQLNSAKVIVQISPDLEQFLVKPLSALSNKYHLVNLIDAKGLTLLPSNSHSHNHNMKKETEDAHHKDHTKEAQHKAEKHVAAPDLHIWLDPQNLILMTNHLKDQLIKKFPDHSFIIKQNALTLNNQLKQLNQEIQGQLSTLKGQNFMVYHNAFQYFEKRYHLQNVGSLTLTSHTLPGSHHIINLKKRLKTENIVCLFTEAGKQPPLVKVLVEKTAVKTAPLSPLGTALKPSRALIFDLLKQLAHDYKSCLE